MVGMDEAMRKLKILADSAKYDVSCSSSGVERKGQKGKLGSASGGGSATAGRRMAAAFPC